MITSDHSLRNKSLRGRNKVAHVELLRGLVMRYAVAVIYINQNARKNKISCFPKRKSKAKNKINNVDFRKVAVSDKMQETKKIFCPPKKKEQS